MTDKPVHQRLAQLSRAAHDAVAHSREIADIDVRIDAALEELWNMKR